jgi:ATP-dependent Clp protease protease subunit
MNASDWQRKGFYAALEAETLNLLIYGPLGEGQGEHAIIAGNVVQQIQDFRGERIDVYINSPGGIVFEGLAIYNALRRHGARKTVYIDGICASAATIVAMAGDRIIAADNATLMVHAVWQTVSGNAADLRKDAEVLDHLTDTLVNLYMQRTGRPRAEVAGWVAEETWFTAAEALRLGLVDEIAAASRAVAQWDCSAFGIKPPRRQDAKEDAPGQKLRCPTTADIALIDGIARAVVERMVNLPGAQIASLQHPNGVIQAAVEASLKAVQIQIDAFMAGLKDGLVGVENRLVEIVEDRCESLSEAYRADCDGCADDVVADPADLASAAAAEKTSALAEARQMVAGWNPRAAAPQE